LPDFLDSEPSAEAIREFYDHIQSDAGIARQRALDEILINLYFGEHLVLTEDTNDPERSRRIKVERVATQEAARTIDLIRSFYSQPPRWGTQYNGIGHRSQVEGEQVGFGLNEAFDQLNPATDAPWKDGVWDQCLLGRRADLIVPGNAYWWDFPWMTEDEGEKDWQERAAEWRKRAPLPIAWFSLPAQSTFPASLSTIDDAALCTKTVSWSELLDVFGEEELAKAEVPVPERQDRHKEMTLGIFSNRSYIAYAYLADRPKDHRGNLPDRLIRVQEHGLDRCAIRILPGMTTGRKEFGYWWQSVLFNVRDLLQQVDTLATRTATSAKFDTYPLLKHKTSASRDDEEQEGSSAGLQSVQEGDIIALDAGDPTTGRPPEDLAAVFQPQHGEQTREFFLFLLQRCAQITGAVEALEGNIPHAGTPAWALNWSSEMAKFKLRPLTDAVMASGRDIAETLSSAVISFGEPIPLAKLDDVGERIGTITLKPETLKKYSVVIAGTYEAKVPQNQRADLSLFMDMLERAKQLGYPSPIWISEKLGGIEDFYRHFGEAQTAWYVMSDEFKNQQAKWLAKQLELSGDDDEGMSVAELMELQDKMDPRVFRKLMMMAGQGGQNGSEPGGVSNEARGAIRAGAPFERAAGGPNPLAAIQGAVQ